MFPLLAHNAKLRGIASNYRVGHVSNLVNEQWWELGAGGGGVIPGPLNCQGSMNSVILFPFYAPGYTLVEQLISATNPLKRLFW